MSFFEKFFGYQRVDGGLPEPYSDGLGLGAFSDIRHLLWALIVIGLCVVAYMFFKNHKDGARKTIVVFSLLLFFTRLSNQIFRACIGAENPAWRAIPFHMCTVLTFLLPIVAFFKIDKLKTAVYSLGIMGGVITIIIGDYFDNKFMTFSMLEGMTAHTLLILIPIIEIATGEWKVEFKNSWQSIAGILVLMGWATLANEVFFKAYDTNYMYLVRNALPGNIGGDYYFLIYVAVYFLFWTLIFIPPVIINKIRMKNVEGK